MILSFVYNALVQGPLKRCHDYKNVFHKISHVHVLRYELSKRYITVDEVFQLTGPCSIDLVQLSVGPTTPLDRATPYKSERHDTQHIEPTATLLPNVQFFSYPLHKEAAIKQKEKPSIRDHAHHLMRE